MVPEKVYKFDKKLNFQHFHLFGAPLSHIGQQVLTRCWPKIFSLKDHFKVTRKCIYIVRISPIFAKLRLETFCAVAAPTGALASKKSGFPRFLPFWSIFKPYWLTVKMPGFLRTDPKGWKICCLLPWENDLFFICPPVSLKNALYLKRCHIYCIVRKRFFLVNRKIFFSCILVLKRIKLNYQKTQYRKHIEQGNSTPPMNKYVKKQAKKRKNLFFCFWMLKYLS